MPHALTHTESDKTGQLLTCLQNSCWTNMQLCASADNLQTRGCVFSFSEGKKHTQEEKYSYSRSSIFAIPLFLLIVLPVICLHWL